MQNLKKDPSCTSSKVNKTRGAKYLIEEILLRKREENKKNSDQSLDVFNRFVRVQRIPRWLGMLLFVIKATIVL
jgi:hypothetical protein